MSPEGILLMVSVFMNVVVLIVVVLMNKHSLKWFDNLKKKPKQQININKEEMEKLVNKFVGLELVEKLYIMRSMFGANYTSLIKVTGNGIIVQGLGNFEEDPEDMDYSG